MNSCKGCGIEGHNKYCELCDILIPAIGGSSMDLVPIEEDMDKAVQRIGLTRGHNGTFWKNLSEGLDDTNDWLNQPRNLPDSHWIIEPPRAWTLDEEMIEEIKNKKKIDINLSARRRLQRGGILPDGSYLTWTDGQFWLDGIALSVPYITLGKLLQIPQANEIDWRGLLYSLNIACSRISPNMPRFRQFHGGRRDYDKEITLHPVIRFILPSMIDGELGREMAFLNRQNREYVLDIPSYLIEDYQWFERWKNYTDLNHLERQDLLGCKTLEIRNGKVSLYLRKNLSWKKRVIPADFQLISRLIKYALSPVDHDEYQFLRCLQYGLLTTKHTALDESNINGIEFLRGIISNPRIRIDSTRKSFLVDGVSGVTWEISPGSGPHRSRFRVRPNSMKDGNLPGRLTDRVCVVETPELRRLVLGDAIGTIILSLLDDVSASTEIETLEPIVRYAVRQQREGQDFIDRIAQRIGRDYELRNRQVDPVEAENFRLERARAEELAIRATVIFPRLWSVLLRLPLGTFLTFNNPPEEEFCRIRIDGFQTTMSIRDELEEQIIDEMLRAAGWNRMADVPQEPGQPNIMYRMYTRMDLPTPNLANAVHRFGELLEPMITIGQRMRIAPGPAWTNFERRDPGIAQLLANTDGPLD